jgi:tetratricopeptide (TPR) repeat protein
MFGPPSLNIMPFFWGFKISKLFRGLKTSDGFLPNSVDDLPIKLVIGRLEEIHNKKPKDWLILYILGDWYIRDKQYYKATIVLEKAYKLHPRDPRSTFALATAYRTLSRAQFLERNNINSNLPIFSDINKMEFDPQTSHGELKKLGLTVDEAAQKAMELFEETLRLGVRPEEKKIVFESLQKMYCDFPHLEMRVKANLKPTYNLQGDQVKGSSGIFKEAMEHYFRLRFLMDAPPKYRFELGEVIRLCQWSIAADNQNGDAYILLANAYSLLDSCVRYSESDPIYYLKWAGAIIQYWAISPLKNYHHTKNIQIGDRLYESIVKSIKEYTHQSEWDITTDMRKWKKEIVNDALSPVSFTKIKKQLENEPI